MCGSNTLHKESGVNQQSIRIKDVARVAGVSTATVSRALSKPDVVSPETLEAVRAAVAQTGYTVNQAARNLRQQRTMGVVALVPNLANPFFSGILAGVSAVLAPAGYNLLVVDTQGPGVDRHIARTLDRGRADGLIVCDGLLPAADLRAEGGLPPVVMACEWIEGLDVPRIRIDNAAGARLAIAHLLDLGHRRIGHLMGPAANVLARTRAQAARQELAAQGVAIRPDWFLPGDFSLESGRACARAWLAMADRPTALFCASDEMACGFIGEVQRHGLVVPRDVSVVGFDDIELVAHVTPALTTIRQPRRAIGERAAAVMLALLAGRAPPESDVVLPVALIARDSTSAPPV
jgi:LacI family transcriptional regulator, repressor for deo operon, udp, cdd, tsx, nupC, and nupG